MQVGVGLHSGKQCCCGKQPAVNCAVLYKCRARVDALDMDDGDASMAIAGAALGQGVEQLLGQEHQEQPRALNGSRPAPVVFKGCSTGPSHGGPSYVSNAAGGGECGAHLVPDMPHANCLAHVLMLTKKSACMLAHACRWRRGWRSQRRGRCGQQP
jgi:hypothetical protein